MRPQNRDGFTIAIVCALVLEADAVEALFDETYDKFSQIYGRQFGDKNAYINGRIGHHNVVLCYLPRMGKGSAAGAAANLRVSYTNIQLALVVGICGGVPFPLYGNTEIVLGDIIISDSVIEYDFGRQYPDGFRRKCEIKETLGPPNIEIQALLHGLQTRKTCRELQERIDHHLQTLQDWQPWQHPGIVHDVLFEASYRHKHHGGELDIECVCASCKSSHDPICEEALNSDCGEVGCLATPIPRKRHAGTETTKTSVHIGTLASADTVMMSGEHRDRITKEGVIGFEMEGAGVWHNMPCIIIKGVCDYADSHKNRRWQDYAAATGASGAKAFLEYWAPASKKSVSLPLDSAREILTAVNTSRDDAVKFERDIRTFGEEMRQQTKLQASNFNSFTEQMSRSLHTNQNVLRKEIASVHEAVGARSSIPLMKVDIMMEILQKISGSLGICDELQTPGPGTEQDASSPNSEMIRSIERLSGLVQERGRTIDTYANDDEEAEAEANGIIDDLKVILESAQKQVNTMSQMPDYHSSRENQENLSTELIRTIQRFNRRFGQGELGINKGVQRRSFQLASVMEHDSSYDRIDIGAGTLAIRFNKRSRLMTMETTDDGSKLQNKNRRLTDYAMTVSFMPTNSQRFHMLVASILQEEISRGSVYVTSRLEVNRLVPTSSPIFKFVKDGDLAAVKKLLRDGQASLRDHDEYGQSLLFYSMLQPEMCKFLVENGADVDHIAYDGNYLHCALQIEFYPETLARDDDLTQASSECRRLLLESGADPTNCPDEQDTYSFLEAAVFSNLPNLIRLAWNPEFVGHFADINEYEVRGEPIFLFYCINVERGYSMETFAELLRIGADIHVRDLLGQTCLHICLKNMGYQPSWKDDIFAATREYKALKFLVESGADPRAVDNRGKAVCEAAYTTSGDRGRMGSYPGDLWDCVLQSCGFDITEFRTRHYRRKAKYTKYYTRELFEHLWRGREEFCPYWDDSPWPPGAEWEDDSSDEYSEFEEGDSDDSSQCYTVSDDSDSVGDEDDEEDSADDDEGGVDL